MSDRVPPQPFPPSISDMLEQERLEQRARRRHPASQAFHDLCDAMKAMHDKKQADYGRANDPFANVRASEDFGVPGWAGCMIRANDKMRRIQKAAQGGTLANEGVEDSLMDLAVYSIIALVLYREEQKEQKGAEPQTLRDAFRDAVVKAGVPEEIVRWDRPVDMVQR